MARIRETLLVILTAIIVLFATQNREPISVSFLVWSLKVPIALIALVPMLAGVVLGAGGTAIMVGRRRRAAAKAESAPTPGLEPASDLKSAQTAREEETTRP